MNIVRGEENSMNIGNMTEKNRNFGTSSKLSRKQFYTIYASGNYNEKGKSKEAVCQVLKRSIQRSIPYSFELLTQPLLLMILI